jgi:hypothetical protein
LKESKAEQRSWGEWMKNGFRGKRFMDEVEDGQGEVMTIQ